MNIFNELLNCPENCYLLPREIYFAFPFYPPFHSIVSISLEVGYCCRFGYFLPMYCCHNGFLLFREVVREQTSKNIVVWRLTGIDLWVRIETTLNKWMTDSQILCLVRSCIVLKCIDPFYILSIKGFFTIFIDESRVN